MKQLPLKRPTGYTSRGRARHRSPVQEKIVACLAGDRLARRSARAEMTELRAGRMGEPLVEPLLVDALRQLNDGLSETEALQVVDQLRQMPDSEEFLRVLRDGARRPPSTPSRLARTSRSSTGSEPDAERLRRHDRVRAEDRARSASRASTSSAS